ncbi:50S ribosomal protein L21 [Candidatus Saganbacteria bacterium]|nr:50S ribosomal protein L21 [Candidatus Saganbacteria bacterium]
MYAVIETGSKQYKVKAGDILEVELLDAKDQVTFDKVMLISNNDQTTVGAPYVSGAAVAAKILGEGKDDKVTSLKYKRKTNYHRMIGHRQRFTRIQIEEVRNGT